MRSSKSRSRNKSNRNRSVGNVVNRVFDSSGPEGKVRGTPQQIIEKYTQLARDATLANDRVAAENFQQHSEHYTRMLGEAMREQEARREAHEAQNRNRPQRDQNDQNNNHQNNQPQASADPASMPQPDVGSPSIVDVPESGSSGLVDTPEAPQNAEGEKPKRRQRRPRQNNSEDSAKPSDKPQEAAE